MPEARERVSGLLDRYTELQKKTKLLQQTVSQLAAHIPAGHQEHTDEYLSAKQAERAAREAEAKVAEARAKVRPAPNVH